MAQRTDPPPFSNRLVRLMRMLISADEGTSLTPITHRIPLQLVANHPPSIYTVILAPDDQGTFLVTCRELPEITTFGEDEEEAMAMAHEAIKEAHSARRSSPDFPY